MFFLTMEFREGVKILYRQACQERFAPQPLHLNKEIEDGREGALLIELSALFRLIWPCNTQELKDKIQMSG